MRTSAEVCVDAGLAIKVVLQESDSDKADGLFQHWADKGTQLIGPSFCDVEMDSILRQKVVARRELTADQASAAFAKITTLPIHFLSEPAQRQGAWEIADEFNLPTVYDATYIALAQLRGCDFWTADQRLFNQVKTGLSFVHWLGDHLITRQSDS